MPTRTIAIGDIHGCSAALDALLDAIRPRPEDTIVTLGDYINRGPDSRKDHVLRLWTGALEVNPVDFHKRQDTD